jgi:transcriptional regulator with XRE-family HTH domain
MVTRDNSFVLQFGQRVRFLRQQKGHSQQHFANLCDLELSQINRIELGKITTSIVHAKIIADALGVKVSELFDF